VLGQVAAGERLVLGPQPLAQLAVGQLCGPQMAGSHAEEGGRSGSATAIRSLPSTIDSCNMVYEFSG
jgi:hypothetical protein